MAFPILFSNFYIASVELRLIDETDGMYVVCVCVCSKLRIHINMYRFKVR